MVTHLCAYYQSAYPTTPTEMPVVPDDVLTRTAATRFMVPAGLKNVLFAFAAGDNLVEARLFSPSLETRKYIARIIPFRRGAPKLDSTKVQIYKPTPPLKLAETEELSILYQTDGTAAADYYVVVSLAPDTLPPPPTGDPIWIKCVGSSTLSKGAWTTVKLTPEVQLEPGIYSIIRFIPISANVVAARLIIPGQVWRPGVIGLPGAESDARDHSPLYHIIFPEYEMGRFSHLQIPEVQFLANDADTNEIVYMKVVKVG